jgi:hypothetical protein
MFIRKAAFEVLELWSEAQELIEVADDWIIDWRWLATRDEEQPSFTSECALIH